MSTDAELLQRYARDRDERAFAELVQRHLGVVYGAALRRTGGRTHLAEDISQKVFTDLARKAASLSHHPALTGWLHRSTRYAAIDAIRSEVRGQKLSETLAAMPDTNLPPEVQVEWSRLRPVLDEVLDELKDTDREAMLLRYFEGLSFTEVGARMNLSENAARMRTERALEKLRGQLGKRGVTSTTAALGLLLANSAFGAAPAGLSATITSTALASAPATGGLVTFLLMNKIAITSLSTLLSAGVVSVAWATLTDSVSNAELDALRAENVRLTQATAGGSPADSAAVANEFATQAGVIVQAVEQRLNERNATSSGRHSNRGQATPHDALMTHAWASDTGDVAVLAKLTTFNEKGYESARAIHAAMPEAIRTQYPTPEELIAFFFIADTLLSPVPGAEVIEPFVATELKPGRMALHRPGTPARGLEFVLTAEGWKHEVPEYYPAILAPRILGNEMLAKLNAR
jgi:RNA polymerase sigma factor (sigma-70 family)